MVSATLGWIVGAFVLSTLLVYAVLVASRRLELMAVPNARSSHRVPTPTMGGLAMVVVLLAFLISKVAAGAEPALGLALGGAVLAVIGLWDDVRELGALLRLACHVLAASLAVYYLRLDWSLAALLLATFLLVWHVNLFNFMDGIDAIAGVQVLVFALGATLLTGGIPGWLGELAWVLAASTLGFLAFNWPPAKIFMGDVGSGFLGLVLGVLALTLAELEYLPLVASLILLSGFWFDASYTLCVRIVTGQRFLSAHRSHLYQKLAGRRGHAFTTTAFAALAVLWLLPLAALATRYAELRVLMLLLAVAPLGAACVRFRAGLPELNDQGASGQG